MFKRLQTKIRKRHLQHVVSQIRSTPPLRMQEAPVVVLSMLCQRDIDNWLVAIKSLYARLRKGGVCILNDGSLSEDDLTLLRQHVPRLEVRHIRDVDTTDLPAGGTWERLITLIELSQDRYAIQLDADIAALGEIPEVLNSVAQQNSFALTNFQRPGIVTLAQAAAFTAASGWASSTHVQTLAECAFSQLLYASERNYTRSSSAFTGIPQGTAQRATIVEFHRDLHGMLGDKWLEWGSEQVTSNYLVANLPGAIELPCPKYANAMPHLALDDSVLLHFFGSVRYDNSRYADACRNIIASLG